MWHRLRPYFEAYPAQERLAALMLVHGFRVGDNRVYAGNVELGDTALARAAGVDRRVVSATVRTIMRTPELLRCFSAVQPVCNLAEVAPAMGWGAIEIVPTSASKPGILAGVATIIAEGGISVRQVIVDDPEIAENPRGLIITESPVPERLIPRIKAVDGVKGVVLR